MNLKNLETWKQIRKARCFVDDSSFAACLLSENGTLQKVMKQLHFFVYLGIYLAKAVGLGQTQ